MTDTKRPREFWRNYFTNGEYEDFKVGFPKGERVFSNIRPELEGRAHTHVKEAVLFREVVPIDWAKVWENLHANIDEEHAEHIQELVEKQLEGEK